MQSNLNWYLNDSTEKFTNLLYVWQNFLSHSWFNVVIAKVMLFFSFSFNSILLKYSPINVTSLNHATKSVPYNTLCHMASPVSLFVLYQHYILGKWKLWSIIGFEICFNIKWVFSSTVFLKHCYCCCYQFQSWCNIYFYTIQGTLIYMKQSVSVSKRYDRFDQRSIDKKISLYFLKLFFLCIQR